MLLDEKLELQNYYFIAKARAIHTISNIRSDKIETQMWKTVPRLLPRPDLKVKQVRNPDQFDARAYPPDPGKNIT